MRGELACAAEGNAAPAQPLGHGGTAEGQKVFHHRIARIRLDLAVGGGRVGEHHAGTEDMAALVQLDLTLARNDVFEDIERKSAPRYGVVWIAKLPATH